MTLFRPVWQLLKLLPEDLLLIMKFYICCICIENSNIVHTLPMQAAVALVMTKGISHLFSLRDDFGSIFWVSAMKCRNLFKETNWTEKIGKIQFQLMRRTCSINYNRVLIDCLRNDLENVSLTMHELKNSIWAHKSVNGSDAGDLIQARNVI